MAADGSVIHQLLDEDDSGATLGTIPYSTIALTINRFGEIAGSGDFTVTVPHVDQNGEPDGTGSLELTQGLYWATPTSDPIKLDPPSGFNTCWPLSMNDDGIIVGVAKMRVQQGASSRLVDEIAVAWRIVNGQVSAAAPLEGLAAANGSSATAINQTVGGVALVAGLDQLLSVDGQGFITDSFNTAVVWVITLDGNGLSVSQGGIVDPPCGDLDSNAWGINNFGEACGVAYDSNSGFCGYAGNQILDIPRRTHLASESVKDVNDGGEVVGHLVDSRNFGSMATLWSGGKAKNLDGLMGNSTFASLTWALKINSAGDIVGFGWSDSAETHAFLMIKN